MTHLVLSNGAVTRAPGRLAALKDLAGRILADINSRNLDHAHELAQAAKLSPIAIAYVASILHKLHAASDAELLRILT